MTPGIYSAWLKIVNNTPYDPINIPVTMTVTSASYGVTLEPPTAAQSGAPGALVTYTLRLTNTGRNTDNFTLSKTGNAWTTDAPANVGPIGSGVGVNLQVIVYVPSGAGIGATDRVTITAASQGNPTRSDTSALTTTAQSPESKVYLPIILK
jgi:hypothetical protein